MVATPIFALLIALAKPPPILSKRLDQTDGDIAAMHGTMKSEAGVTLLAVRASCRESWVLARHTSNAAAGKGGKREICLMEG